MSAVEFDDLNLSFRIRRSPACQCSALALCRHRLPGLRRPATGRRVFCVFGGWCLSIAALNWAFEVQDLSSSRKFVLVALADYASECGTCWPSTDTLCRKTCLDRKTVVAALDSLLEAGLIFDTGKRSGATAQIKVYRLKIPVESKAPKNGTLSESKAPVFPAKASQKRDAEGSQKRDTEPSGEPKENQEAQTPSFQEFNGYCQIHGGPPEWYAKDKWLAAEQDNWARKPKWTAYADRIRAWWMQDGSPLHPDKKGINGQPRPTNRLDREDIEREIRRLEAELPQMRQDKSPELKPTFARIAELEAKLRL